MANNAPTAPTTTPPPHDERDKVEVPEVREFLRHYGTSLLIAVGAAVVLALGIGAYRNMQGSRAERANQMLNSARAPEQFQEVVKQYPTTPSGPLALLAAGAAYYDGGQYDLAQRTYAQFAQIYPRHALLPGAELGRLQSLEAAGQTDVALEGYTKFIAARTNSYLVPLALFGQARCLEQKEQFDAARVVYENFIAANPKSPWLNVAKAGLQYLEQKKRGQHKVMVGLTPPPPLPAAITPAPAKAKSLNPLAPPATAKPPAR